MWAPPVSQLSATETEKHKKSQINPIDTGIKKEYN